MERVIERDLMLRFSAERLRAQIEKKGLSKSDFVRRVIAAAPEDMKPNSANIYQLIKGASQNPGANYLSLFASVLGCSRDDFFGEVTVTPEGGAADRPS